MIRVFDSLSGMVNKLTGRGTNIDKTTHNEWHFMPLEQYQLKSLYRASWMAKKAVRIPAVDMLSKGWDFTLDDGDKEKVFALQKKLKVVQRVKDAMIMARLYGGSALILGDGASDPMQPLEINRMGLGGLKYINVVPSYSLMADDLDLDVYSPYYNQPKSYQIVSVNRRSSQFFLHPSRVVKFLGDEIPEEHGVLEDTWGDSVLQSVVREINAATTGVSNIHKLLEESTVSYYKIQGLLDALATTEGTEKVQKILELAEMMKSSLKAVALDAEGEGLEQFSANFAGLPEIQQTLLQLISGAVDVPVTRFLGQSPSGMNATGESDLTNYYDRLKTDQEVDLGPTLEPVMEALIRSALGTMPSGATMKFNPLWEMDAKEEAELDQSKAETLRTYQDAGMMPDEVAAKLARSNVMRSRSFMNASEVWPEDMKSTSYRPTTEEVEKAKAMDAAPPRPLYVARPVLNAAEIIQWAKDQGFETTLEPDDLHVTIAYSKAPVDWFAVGESYAETVSIGAGGPRAVERFDGGATVLQFSSSELSWRHEAMKEHGATWDHPQYAPHITISYAGAPDPEGIEPYRGRIELGPEVFKPIDPDWKERVQER